jgi:hypothetical protein
MNLEEVLAISVPLCIVVYVIYSYLTHKEK